MKQNFLRFLFYLFKALRTSWSYAVTFSKGQTSTFFLVVFVGLDFSHCSCSRQHLHSMQDLVLVKQCCVDPDLQRAEKFDPAQELNKRISWHSSEWRADRRTRQPGSSLAYSDLPADCFTLWPLELPGHLQGRQGIRRDSFHLDRYAEMSSLLFELPLLHTF